MVWGPDIALIKGKRHQELLRLAYQAAWYHSDDPVTRVGAIIVRPDLSEVLGCGANHLPKGVKPTKKELHDGLWRYENLIHSEEAAINAALNTYKDEHGDNFASIHLKLDGATMYMPWAPCYGCAEKMVDAGIKRWVGHKEFIMKTPENWQESLDQALTLFSGAGVERFMYEGKIGGVRGLHRSIEWQP